MAYEPRLIRDPAQHAECMAEIERLRLAPFEAGARDRLDLLEKLVDLYEQENLAARATNALDAIRLRMQEKRLRQRDLAAWLGGRNRASEVLSGKRPLTASMIAVLSRELNIPAALLLGGVTPRRRKRESAETKNGGPPPSA